MYALFTLLAGACQSAMASLNGMLTEHVGMFGMSLMVHAIGGILLIFLYESHHQKRKAEDHRTSLVSLQRRIFGIFLVASSSYCISILGVSFMTCIFRDRTARHFRCHRPFRLVRGLPGSL